MKTFRRDKLRRLVEQRKVVSINTYSFDDMHGQSGSNNEMPVQMMPEDRLNCRDGIIYLFSHDFTSKSGGCYQNENGTITLIVHSNKNLTFKILL